MLQNAYLLAKIGADTAENEQHFAELCQNLATTLRVPRRVRVPEGAATAAAYATVTTTTVPCPHRFGG